MLFLNNEKTFRDLGSGFAECIKGDCINGYGTYTYANGSKYVGEFKNAKGTDK